MSELTMGTWDIGPFDNDSAADFSYQIDQAAGADDKAAVFLAAFRDVAETGEDAFLDSYYSVKAVASAALLAAQCPGGEPVTTSYAPKDAIPVLPATLRPLAVAALDRVLGPDSELLELWEESSESEEWKAGVLRLRAVLAGADA